MLRSANLQSSEALPDGGLSHHGPLLAHLRNIAHLVVVLWHWLVYDGAVVHKHGARRRSTDRLAFYLSVCIRGEIDGFANPG